jgi:hypothetical protein
MRLFIEVDENGITQQEFCKEVGPEAVVRISVRSGVPELRCGHGRCRHCGYGDFLQHRFDGGLGASSVQVQ